MKEIEKLSREFGGIADGLRDLRNFVKSRQSDCKKYESQGLKTNGCVNQLVCLIDSSEAVAIWISKQTRDFAKKEQR